jgi:hypothetical protein
MSDASKITYSEAMSLEYLLTTPEHGVKKNCIYVIRFWSDILYVGKTVVGVRRRIYKHIYDGDLIGKIMKTCAPEYTGWIINIFAIDYNLAETEIFMIQELDPLTNHQKYRTRQRVF